ncbi:MAG: glutaredoxin domain-containing protein [Planctomycetota bacterium]
MLSLKTFIKRFTSPNDPRHAEGFVVYTAADCPCSKETIALLRRSGVEPCVLDIDEHPDVRHEYGAGTPIVKVDGRFRFFGKVDPLLLRRLLHARQQGQ